MDRRPPPLVVDPPLLNSASPWATTLGDLEALYRNPSVGAVTTRTALLGPEGFPHDDRVHRYVFFDPSAGAVSRSAAATPAPSPGDANTASLNNLGYSPLPLADYLDFVGILAEMPLPATAPTPRPPKTIILSVTGTPSEVAEAYRRLVASLPGCRAPPAALEINLSCPNIPGAEPPAYSPAALQAYLCALPGPPQIPVGLKVPPYTHASQFAGLVASLEAFPNAVSFVTATNTLGSCLLVGDPTEETDSLPPPGLGGMGGASLHPLALGNVATIRRLLDERPGIAHIRVVGVGGVGDARGYRRMRDAGAYAVAVGTALGRKGGQVFGEIEEGIGGKW